MLFRPQLLDALEALDPGPLEITAWRHMFNDHLPDEENTRGARWNPPDVAALYLSLTREGAIAEGDHAIAIQPLRPRVTRHLFAVEVQLDNILDLRDRAALDDLGIDDDALAGADLTRCQEVGGAASWLGHDGLLVPSARSDAANLVVFAANRAPDTRYEFGEPESP